VAVEVRRSRRDPIPVAEAINRQWRRRLESHGVPPSDPVDDADFLRRVCLDVTGRIPSYERTVEYLNNSNPDRRHRLIDELLGSRDFGTHFGQRWRTLIWPRDTSTTKQGVDLFTPWLAEQFQSNRAWSDVVTDLLTSELSVVRDPQATFFLANSDSLNPQPELLAASTGRLFLGVQIGCAQCHNHPFASWTQDDFWGLAAFFSRVRRQSKSDFSLTEATDGPLPAPSIVIPDGAGKAAGSAVAARFLDGRDLPLEPDQPLRPQLAAWITARDNPYFARAMVNRLWAHFFGRGLVDPVDDMRRESPASQPELLQLLADEFVESNFDVQHLIRCLCLSDSYQRSSDARAGNESDRTLFSRMAARVMTPEVLYDSLDEALNADPLYRPQPGVKKGGRGRRIELGPREEWVRFFGRAADAHRGDQYVYGIPELLRLMNSAPLNEVAPMIAELTARGDDPARILETLYLVALSRRPTPPESSQMVNLAKQNESLEKGFADVFWVILHSSEFVVIR
jgi:hypothetical protein